MLNYSCIPNKNIFTILTLKVFLTIKKSLKNHKDVFFEQKAEAEAYLELSRTSTIMFFCENS